MTKSPAATEQRSVNQPVEARADGNMLAGYAAVFNSDALIYGEFLERIAPGAFSKSIKSDDVRAYFDHDRGRLLGRTKAGTLRLKEDDHGLAVEIDLPETSDGADVRALLTRGDLDGMSFGFIVTKQTWDETVEPAVRTIEEVQLIEVSVVSEPAYEDTTAALRSIKQARDAARETNFANAARRARMRITLDLKGQE